MSQSTADAGVTTPHPQHDAPSTTAPAQAHTNTNATNATGAAAITGQHDNAQIEADDWGTDSAYGDDQAGDDDNASTSSITSSILRYREENGRTYHAYKVICSPHLSINWLRENWIYASTILIWKSLC